MLIAKSSNCFDLVWTIHIYIILQSKFLLNPFLIKTSYPPVD